MLSALVAIVLHASTPAAPTETVNVFAAASLSDAFKAIALKFEARHPGWHVALNFAGSQTLAAQINHGAPADVFASAAELNAKSIKCFPETWSTFALNRLAIVTRRGFGDIRSVRDLPRAHSLVLAAAKVPAGEYSEQVLAKAGAKFGKAWLESAQSKIVSRELDVRSVLVKVRLGQADAGIVYTSDAASARGQVGIVAIPDALNVIARYPVVVPSTASNPAGGRAFSSFLLGREARAELSRFGFILPPKK